MKKEQEKDVLRQKNEILKLREKGYGYKSIAGILKISRDKVRSVCKSHGLTGYGQQIVHKDLKRDKVSDKCALCKKVINVVKRSGRKSKFCSERCRLKWWKENEHKKDKKAWYCFKCQYCGKEFKAYGNKNRKFCSVKCSTENRFGSTSKE